jgi:hypothetical protein
MAAFAHADRAAAMAAASWVERNDGTTPDSEAGILLEEVAAYTTYYYEVGVLDALAANQMMYAVEQATWTLHSQYPTAEARNSIDMDEAKRVATEYLATLQEPPPPRRCDTPPGKGYVPPSPAKYAKHPTAPAAATRVDPAMGQVCEELFGPAGGDMHTSAPTGVNWKKVKSRRPFVEHKKMSVDFGSDVLSSMKGFVTSANVAAPLAITLGCGALVVAGGSIFTAAAMAKSAANVVQIAGHAIEFGRLYNRKAPAKDYAKVAVGAGITFLNSMTFNGLGGNMVFLHRIARKAHTTSKVVQATARVLGKTTTYTGDDLLVRAYIDAQTLREETGGAIRGDTDPKYAQMMQEMNRAENDLARDAIYHALHPSEWGAGTAALAAGAGAMGVAGFLGWSRYMYTPERQNAYLEKNDNDDAKKWQKQLIEYLTKRIKPAIVRGLKGPQNQRALWRRRDDERVQLEQDVKDVFRDRVRLGSDDPEYVQVSHFVWEMQRVRRQICDLYYEIFNQVLPDRDPNDLPPRNPPKGPCDREVTAFGATAATGGRVSEWLWGDVHNEEEGPSELKVSPPWGDGPPPERKWALPEAPQETAAEAKSRLALAKAAAKERDALEKRHARAKSKIMSGYLKLTEKSSGRNKVGWPTDRAMNALDVRDRQMQDLVTRLALKINLAAFESYGADVDVLQLEDMIVKLQTVRIEAQNFGHSIIAAQKPDVLLKVKHDFDALGLPARLDTVANQQYSAKTALRIEEQRREDELARQAAERAMRGAAGRRAREGPVFGADEVLNLFNEGAPAVDGGSVVDDAFARLELD